MSDEAREIHPMIFFNGSQPLPKHVKDWTPKAEDDLPPSPAAPDEEPTKGDGAEGMPDFTSSKEKDSKEKSTESDMPAAQPKR